MSNIFTLGDDSEKVKIAMKVAMKILKKYCKFGGFKPFVWLGIIFGIFSGKLVDRRLKSSGVIGRCYIFVVFVFRAFFGVAGVLAILSASTDRIIPVLATARCLTQFTALTGDAFIVAFLEKRFVKVK